MGSTKFTHGSRGWKILRSKVRPFKKKTRVAKKKMGAVVKFKRAGKIAKKRRFKSRLAKMLNLENVEALAREMLADAWTRLAKMRQPAPLAPPTPSPTAKLSYD